MVPKAFSFLRQAGLVSAALALLTTLSIAPAHSFDCSGVTLPSSIVICSDPELMQLADERQTAINEARGRVGEEAWPKLWDDQKAWVRSYATTCGVPPDSPPPMPVTASIKACFKRAAVARIAYLRSYGSPAGASPPAIAAIPAMASDRIGPGFDCTKVTRPLAMMICADKELSRVDLLFNQAYWALFQQLDETARQRLKEENIAFIDRVQDDCEIPRAGSVSPSASHSRECAREWYRNQRGIYLARLSSPASDEARRSIERHVQLERKLRELGFLTTPLVPEGVYAAGTRQAIVAWQRARGRTTTGLLSDADASAMEREGLDSAALPPSRPPAPAPVAPIAPIVPSPPVTPAPKSQNAGIGTAFAVNTSGEFLTNYHVVKGCAGLRVRISGEWHEARTIASDERNDLAAIRARNASSVPALRFRDGKGIRPADAIVAIGFPYADILTKSQQVTTGAVSALAGIKDDTRFLQLTAPVQPGNSGGPLLDLSGNVVGVVSARLNKLLVAEATGTLPENINFAIKSGHAREFLDANCLDYGTAPSATKLDPADVGEMAAKSVVLVECR